MGGIIKKIASVAKSVMSNPLFQMVAPFIPVVGPALAMASKVFTAFDALKKGDLLGAAGSFLGGSGVGNALQSTLGKVMGNVSSLLGQDGMNFATSALKAIGGNSPDVLKVAQMAAQAIQGSQNQDLQQIAQTNAAQLAQYSQAQQYV